MAEQRARGFGGRVPRRHTALLVALVAIVVALSTAIYVGVGWPFGRDSGDGNVQAADPTRRPGSSAAPASSSMWVGSWSTSPAAAEPNSDKGYARQSIRNVVHTSVGGSAARVTLSNLYGRTPLTITHATVALSAAPGTPDAVPGTVRRVAFSGNTTVVIPPGGQVTSDAVRLTVPVASDLLITTYAPKASGPVTYHPHARQISYVAEGNRTADTAGAEYKVQTPYWRYVSAVDVLSQEAEGSVVVLGDSLTDGVSSTVGANHRWTDFLAERLRSEAGAPRYGVLNQGISGNRVLTDGGPDINPSALSRFDRDVLSRTGVKAVVIVLGVNDLLRPPYQTDPERITNGLKQLTDQAHARGLRVVGATLMPFHGFSRSTPELESVRQQVNATIRSGEIFDAVVDFDRAVRDPYAPDRLLPAYDSGDHLHLSDDGYQRMAETFNPRDLVAGSPAEL